ncbi:MAG TPA: hypothetical protein DGD08_09425 [Gemmatimonas aurantiaca]|uniref:SH3b domain-containing protein n=2 Tax=Gemmatimonas aurantiaca TaxID=173480 RepID=C1A9E1_GEMAT|nr:SH3 domain-containing protein [Gemmatimonas aurantiaca]BAH39118.1 hypothetical protein GAU_2076 [Gemmatimonas aurantiaca T-27]HCT57416.1 hypothetical protein [Gemmatimonas aurantiaca]
MAYLRCTECGSKALRAASQCPRCAHPFNLHDARGERVKLKACRGCGILHRPDAVCHWCGEVKSTWRLSGPALRSAAAIALTVTAAGGVWRYGPALRDVTSALAATAIDHAPDRVRTVAAGPTNAASVAVGQSIAADAALEAALDASAGVLDMGDSSMVANGLTTADSIQWTPAVARTWVNVRSDASRGGEVVGVIKPASRAMLGTDRAGWRQVRLSDVTGWVDPRLFEPDSLRTRGE